METKSEAIARRAFEHYRDGELERCIMLLVDYADKGVNNQRTEEIFKRAIRDELHQLDE